VAVPHLNATPDTPGSSCPQVTNRDCSTGAVTALHQLRAAGAPLALVTNTTSRTRASIASVLAGAGFPVSASDVLTAPVIAAGYLHDRYPGTPVPGACCSTAETSPRTWPA
jgi:ribonucleotide monophosphatase NagD (HAD superfamily)